MSVLSLRKGVFKEVDVVIGGKKTVLVLRTAGGKRRGYVNQTSFQT